MNSPLATLLFSAFKRSRPAPEPEVVDEGFNPSSGTDFEKDPIKVSQLQYLIETKFE
jgi:hypothetical protein